MRVLAVVMVLMAAAAVRAEPAPCAAGFAAEQVLHELNALRAGARSCGAQALPAVGALRWNAQLAASARDYAEELARRDTLSHQGQQAGTLRERLAAAGYRMRRGGENLAAGPETWEQTLAQWVDSPAHCENLMFADFQEIGLACVAAPGRYGRFWVLHLGRRSGASAPDEPAAR